MLTTTTDVMRPILMGLKSLMSKNTQATKGAFKLAECFMPILLLESTSICVSFLLLLRVPPLMKPCITFKVSSIPLSEKPALSMALQRMTMSGINVLQKQGTWQLVVKCATSLLPLLRIAILLIQGHYGTPFGKTSVMI